MNSAIAATSSQWRLRPSPGYMLAGLALLLVAASVGALFAGAVELDGAQVLQALLGWASGEDLPPTLAVVGVIRLPRILLALLVGASLAVSGAAMQGLFRNPLADPGLIGVSSGAALGAVAVIVLSSWLPLPAGPATLPLAAATGALLACLLVYRLGRTRAGTDVATLLLAGIAINAIAGAATGLLTYFANDTELRSLTFWLMGSLAGAGWQQLLPAACVMLLASTFLCLMGRPLNALMLGEDVAWHLGYPVERFKVLIVLLCALSVGAAVAVAGIIGFVGLVVPHLLRLVIGSNQRLLLPASALLGAQVLLAADTFARNLMSPAELPIGIITSLLGGPFFVFLLMGYRRRL